MLPQASCPRNHIIIKYRDLDILPSPANMAELADSMASRTTSLTVAVDPVGLVITECIAVMSAMRKHPRWAHSSVGAILSGGPTQELGTHRKSAQHGNEEGSLGSVDAGWRWGARSKKGKSLQDNPLMSAFTKLRSELRGCKGTRIPLHTTKNTNTAFE